MEFVNKEKKKAKPRQPVPMWTGTMYGRDLHGTGLPPADRTFPADQNNRGLVSAGYVEQGVKSVRLMQCF